MFSYAGHLLVQVLRLQVLRTEYKRDAFLGVVPRQSKKLGKCLDFFEFLKDVSPDI